MPKKNKDEERFVHCADLHLGYKQYGLDERVDDFFGGLEQVISYMSENNISTLIIAGDLFHKKDLSPEILLKTEEYLGDLQRDYVSVFVTPGNHDTKHIIDSISWLEYLDERKLINYIADENVVTGKLMIHGMPYYGASTKQKLEELEEYFKKTEKTTLFNALVLHAGVIGVIPNTGNIKPEDLLRFSKYLDCVLLGHIHKPYIIEDFIFNPGSTEACSTTESNFGGGFHDITINHSGVKCKHIKTIKRPMIQVEVDEMNLWNLKWDKLFEINKAKGNLPQFVMTEVTITGMSDKKPDTKKIAERIKKENDLFYVIIKDKTTRIDDVVEIDVSSRETIERQVISELTKDEQLTELIIDIKNSPNDDAETTYKQFAGYREEDE